MACVRHARLAEDLREAFRNGMVVGGNSAGAAIMSKTMIAQHSRSGCWSPAAMILAS
jgi:cyanophycinase-like exopeptidase